MRNVNELMQNAKEQKKLPQQAKAAQQQAE
jgi:hypothetical protein